MMSVLNRDPVPTTEHVVHFYEHVPELVGVVARFAGAALAAGEAAVLVSTPEHAASFEEAISMAGIDVARARAEGRLVMVDAARLLDGFMVDGMPDPSLFADLVGATVNAAAGAGRRLSVYGEMVALLWEWGQVPAAVHLEELWNGLIAEVGFSLLCSYPSEVADSDGLFSLARVCHLHSAVAGAEPDIDHVTESFPVSPLAPRAARRFVDDALSAWDVDAVSARAALVVSELATNALLHAHSAFEVHVLRRGASVRITVSDHSPEAPELQDPTLTRVSGRGLLLVDAVSARWGHERRDGGKVVWAELTA